MHRHPAPWLLALALATGCAGDKSASDSAGGAPGGGEADGGEGGAEDGSAGDGSGGDEGAGEDGGDGGEEVVLNGVPPESPVPLPDFAARAQDGSPRGPSDLRGAPTVMWFYPLAASAG